MFALENNILLKVESRNLEYSVDSMTESHGLLNMTTTIVNQLVSLINSVDEFLNVIQLRLSLLV